jgi:hypothetical protein
MLTPKQELSWEICENLDDIKKKFALFLKIFSRTNSIYSPMGLHFISPATATYTYFREMVYSTSPSIWASSQTESRTVD